MGHHSSWGRDFESLFNQHGPQGRRGGEWGGQWGGLGAVGRGARRTGAPAHRRG